MDNPYGRYPLANSLSPIDDFQSRYQTDGYCFPVDVFSSNEAIAYRHRLESIERRFQSSLPLDRFLKFDPHYLLPVVDELVRLPSLLDIVAELLGPDLLVSNTNIFLKEANSEHFVTWHQDLRYIGLDGDDFLTVWLALTPANKENGCMQFLRGSHQERLEHVDTYAEHNMLPRGQSIVNDIAPSRVVDVLLEPGQASIHHGWMAHASGANRSEERRFGLVIRYMAPHLKQTIAPQDYGMLVRGEDRYQHFVSPPRPTQNFEPLAIQRYEKIRSERRGFLYSQAKTVRY